MLTSFRRTIEYDHRMLTSFCRTNECNRRLTRDPIFIKKNIQSYISGTLHENTGTSFLILGTTERSSLAMTVSSFTGSPCATVVPHGLMIMDVPAKGLPSCVPTVLLDTTKNWFSIARAICKCFQWS